LILLLALSGNIAVIIFLLSLNFLGILYTLFLKGVTNKIPLFKNIFVSFIWASGAIFLPLLYYSKTISLPFILAYLFIWIEAFLNTIFFDIKDEESDRLRGLKTMPAILGNKRTLQFLYIANVLAFIPLLLGVYLNILPLFTLSILALLIYKSYYLHIGGAADDKGLRTITYTLIDTEFIIMLVLLIIGSLIMNIL
jgi:4-hydroxybenzoate polyprenyltransferase